MGRIGIGKTNPYCTLDIRDAVHAGVSIDSPDGASLYFKDSSSAIDEKFMMIRNRDGVTEFSSLNDSFGYNKNVLSLDHDTGNVGIDTMEPSEKLELLGGGIQLNGEYGIGFKEIPYDGAVTTEGAKIYYDYDFLSINGDFLVIEKTDSNTGQNNPDGGIVFTNKGVDGIRDTAMIIRGNSNVGIGTTDPNSKLEVSGGDIRVTGGSFIDDGTTLDVPDYVFEDNYDLKSINEVKEYIIQNKHLERIPNQNDKEGWSKLTMQDRDMKLLEKIEELTLYIIELKEEIETLKNK